MVFSNKTNLLSTFACGLLIVSSVGFAGKESRELQQYGNLNLSVVIGAGSDDLKKQPQKYAQALVGMGQLKKVLVDTKEELTLSQYESDTQFYADKLFDELIAQNNIVRDVTLFGEKATTNKDGFQAIQKRSLADMYKERDLINAVYGMMSAEQQNAVRENADKKLVGNNEQSMTRCEELNKFNILINKSIVAREATFRGKIEKATIATKKVAYHKATAYVATTTALILAAVLIHQNGIDRVVALKACDGAVSAYNTILSDQARKAIASAAQKGCHAVIHGSKKAGDFVKKAGVVALDSAKRLGVYVSYLFSRRAPVAGK